MRDYGNRHDDEFGPVGICSRLPWPLIIEIDVYFELHNKIYRPHTCGFWNKKKKNNYWHYSLSTDW
jgi:hypothetical protein